MRFLEPSNGEGFESVDVPVVDVKMKPTDIGDG